MLCGVGVFGELNECSTPGNARGSLVTAADWFEDHMFGWCPGLEPLTQGAAAQIAAEGETVTALGAGALKTQMRRYQKLSSIKTFCCMKVLIIVCLLCFGKRYGNRIPRNAWSSSGTQLKMQVLA